jgi:hypothetical protein
MGIEHTTFINVVSLVSMVILAVLLTMQWTGPMLNEVPIIVIMIWILLSTQSTSYCICCTGTEPHPHHMVHSSGIGGGGDTEPTNVDIPAVADIISVSDIGDDDDDDGPPNHHPPTHQWNNLKNCNKEAFYLFYSILSAVLLLASIFADVRNYYVSFFIRVVVLVLIFTLIILLVVSPSTCSQFSITDNSFIIIRITLYHVLWFMNHYKGLTERVLEMNYSNSLQIVASSGGGAATTTKKKKVKVIPPTTPLGTLSELDRITSTIDVSSTSSKKGGRRRRDEPLLPKSDSDSDDSSDSGDDEGEEGRLIKHIKKLVKLNQFYGGAWFSWKNRSYNRNILRIIDLARTIWVLSVSPLFLVVLVPIEAIWLLYHIRKNTSELLESNKITGILSYEYDYLNK